MIDKNILFEEIVLDNLENVKKANVIDRSIKIKLIPNKIKVIYGVRRGGKTYFLFQIIKKHFKDDFLYINFEDERLINTTTKELNELLKIALSIKNTKNLFFDEIQNIDSWDKFIRRLNDSGFNIFITGSSSKLLSKEISTSLRGRNIKTEILPLNFKEFLKFKNFDVKERYSTIEKAELLKYLNEFIKFGGFPEITLIDNEEIKKDILREYLDSIFYRDVVERHNIRNIKEIKVLRNILINLFANEISIKKIINLLKEFNTKISRECIYNYLDYFGDSYLIFLLNNFSYKTKTVSNSKLYIIDGMWNFSLNFSRNKGRILENLVFLELRKKGFVENENLFYIKGKNYEVDFLIFDKEKELIQVCYELNEINKEREIKAFEKAIKDLKLDNVNLKIITYDTEGFEKITVNDKEYLIKIIPFWKWSLI
ncbi:ATP-binding protein [Methanocaldococcus fervens]|uniref:ATPase n=1 Tax=Methanocaldococcus fervens (strain DSM 4213 / JCM 15782 / AG86) TaxID=573064 RepID=C7P5A5_METFA|nr:ATP-binding protein [Methanocaldococcus fervens]ACV25283.1 ATPase [Methanocaldococcus fervens AG86]